MTTDGGAARPGIGWFERFGVSERTLREGLSAAMSRGGDFADLFFQHRVETDLALERCGGNIGTPVLTFGPPDGPSFFGPVINKAPKGAEALELWDAVSALGHNPHFSELKRSLRGRPDFDA